MIEKAYDIDQEGTHMVVIGNGKVFTSNITSGSVTTINLETNAVIHTNAGEGSEDLALSLDGTEVWVANQEEQTLAVIDTRSNVRLTRIENVPYPVRLTMTGDGHRVLVTTLGDDSLRVYDRRTKDLLKTISLGLGAAPMDVCSLAPGFAVVSLAYRNQLAVVALGSGEISQTIPTSTNPDGVACW